MVAAMVQRQFPEYAGEPLSFGSSGWDNVLVRIGDSLAARLPRRELAAKYSSMELDWLPVIGQLLDRRQDARRREAIALRPV